MSNNTYVLVNPHIQGKFKTSIKATNSINAAKKLYRSLSEHFNNNVPKFFFTIQKGSSGKGKYYHFKVTEKRTKEDIDYNLEQHSFTGENNANKKFGKRLSKFKNKINKIGGKKKSKKSRKKSKKDDSSDSSDSSISSDDYSRTHYTVPYLDYPIYHWWYDPYVYNLDYVYVPTFYSYLTPYVEIRTAP